MAAIRDSAVRRLFQFRLTTFLLFVLLIAVAVGWWADRRRCEEQLRQRECFLSVLRMALDTAASNRPSGSFFGGSLKQPLPHTMPFSRVDDLLSWVRNGPATVRDSMHLSFGSDCDAKAAVPTLLELLHDKDGSVRCRAAYSLGEIGLSEPSDVFALASAVRDATAQRDALLALQKLKSNARGAAPLIAEEIASPSDRDVAMLVQTVRCVEPSFDLVPYLMRALQCTSPRKRYSAADALGKMGLQAAEAAPQVAAMLNDENDVCRHTAVSVIARIARPHEALEFLLQAFANEKDQAVRAAIATTASDLDRRMRLKEP